MLYMRLVANDYMKLLLSQSPVVRLAVFLVRHLGRPPAVTEGQHADEPTAVALRLSAEADGPAVIRTLLGHGATDHRLA